MLGQHGGDLACGRVEAAGGAVLHDHGTLAAGGGGHGGDGGVRLGATVGRGVERAGPPAAAFGQQGRGFGAVEQARADLVGAGGVEPGFVAGEVGRGVADIDHAGAGKAHVGADAGGHAVP